LNLRMAIAMALVALLDAAALTLLALLGVPPLLVACVGAAFLAAQLLLAPALALKAVRARPAGARDEPELHALVERLCQLGDIPKPALAVTELEAPIAFAVARGRRSGTVCVSYGLLEALEPEELAGVLAHELSHLANRDAAVMSVASLVPMLTGLCLRLAFWDGTPEALQEGREECSGSREALVLLGWLLSPALMFGMIVVRILLAPPLAVAVALYALTLPAVAALSRYREFAADRSAALLTGSPSALASALLRLSGDLERIPRSDLRSIARANALLVMPAPPRVPVLLRLTATHPPVERRVQRLLALERESAPT
jgi:heat shock protein HtpX